MINFPVLPLDLLYLLSFLVSAGTCFFTLNRRRVPGKFAFVFAVSCEALYITGYILEFISPSLADKVFWDNFQYLPSLLIPCGLLAFAFAYANLPPDLTRRINILQCAVSMLILGLVYAINFQAGGRAGAVLISDHAISMLVYPFGYQDWIAFAFIYIRLLFAIALLGRLASHQAFLFRRQTVVIMIGLSIPILITLLSLFGFSIGPQRDDAPIAFAISNLFIAWGLFHFQLFDVVPVAREVVIERMTSPFIVLDEGNRVVDLNPAARAIIQLPDAQIIGKEASQVLPAFIRRFVYLLEDEIVSEIQMDGRASAEGLTPARYELHLTTIHDHSNQRSGRLLFLYDITNRKHNEELLHKAREEQVIRQSEVKFRSSIEQFTEGFILIDGQGCINEWNHGQEQITGLLRSEALGLPYWEVMERLTIPERRSPQRTDYYRELISSSIATGQIDPIRRSVEGIILSTDGLRKHIQQTSFPMKIAGEYWLGSVTRDISATKQSQLALERYATRMAILNQIDRAILAADSPREVALVALDGLQQVVPFRQAQVILFDRPSQAHQEVIHKGGMPNCCCNLLFDAKWAASIERDFRSMEKVPDLAHSRYAQACAGCLEAGLRSLVAAPLYNHDQPIGALTMCFMNAAALHEENLDIIRSVADQFAIAIQQAELTQQTRQRLQELSGLHEIALTFNYFNQVGDPFGSLAEKIAQLTGAQHCLIALKDEQNIMRAQPPGYGVPGDLFPKIFWPSLQTQQVAEILKRGYDHAITLADLPVHVRPVMEMLGFTTMLSVPINSNNGLLGWIVVADKPGGFVAEDFHLLSVLASQVNSVIINTRLYTQLAEAYDATIQGWSRALELRDKETRGHSQRVTTLALELAVHYGLSKEDLVHFRRGVLLHDIGKMGIPDRILLKQGELDEEEWQIMRQHPNYAYHLLSGIEYLRPALDIPYCHHERWDGTGYPRGLQGEEIPLWARLFTVVDVWDAVLNDRPYRSAWNIDQAAAYIRSNAGTHFDPQVVDIFLKMVMHQPSTG